MPQIVVIDDDQVRLEQLRDALLGALDESQARVVAWIPIKDDEPAAQYKSWLESNTGLVITDLDLTRRGLSGFSGAAVSTWCQSQLIPVAVFSVQHATMLPSVPELFELRLPSDTQEACRFAVSTLLGFKSLYDLLERDAIASMRSPAEVLAAVLDRPHLEGQFSLYMSRLGAAGFSVMDRLRQPPSDIAAKLRDKAFLLAYVLGHVLWNLIFRFPGPILSSKALCAYVATAESEADALAEILRLIP